MARAGPGGHRRAVRQDRGGRLEEVRLAALEARAEALLECGKFGDAIAELETLAAAHPLRERLWSLRMLALYRAGRQADALRAYRDLRAILADELAIEPGPALRDLHTGILRQDPALDRPARGEQDAGHRGRGQGARRPRPADPLRADRRRRAHRLPGSRPGRHADILFVPA